MEYVAIKEDFLSVRNPRDIQVNSEYPPQYDPNAGVSCVIAEMGGQIISDTIPSDSVLSKEIIAKSSYSDQRGSQKDHMGSNKKKRSRDYKPDASDRICHFLLKGMVCTFGNSCEYNHNTLEYLSRKPSDIADECHCYNTFGWCSNGIMCRFGSKHIDKTTGNSLIRSLDDGGVINKVMINILDKKLQIALRKRNYNYKQVL